MLDTASSLCHSPHPLSHTHPSVHASWRSLKNITFCPSNHFILEFTYTRPTASVPPHYHLNNVAQYLVMWNEEAETDV